MKFRIISIVALIWTISIPLYFRYPQFGCVPIASGAIATVLYAYCEGLIELAKKW